MSRGMHNYGSGEPNGMDEFRALVAKIADGVIAHALVEGVMAELRGNLGVSDDGLPAYGIAKVAHHAAQVALATAWGVNPDALKMTTGEAASEQWRMAAEAVLNGVPTHVIEGDEEDHG